MERKDQSGAREDRQTCTRDQEVRTALMEIKEYFHLNGLVTASRILTTPFTVIPSPNCRVAIFAVKVSVNEP